MKFIVFNFSIFIWIRAEPCSWWLALSTEPGKTILNSSIFIHAHMNPILWKININHRCHMKSLSISFISCSRFSPVYLHKNSSIILSNRMHRFNRLPGNQRAEVNNIILMKGERERVSKREKKMCNTDSQTLWKHFSTK